MPQKKRSKPLYQRGDYRLDRRFGRENLIVTFYDRGKQRERSISAGTNNVEEGKAALDRIYLQNTHGAAICPTCGQHRTGTSSTYVTVAITDYLILKEDQTSAEAINARLAHIINFIATLPNADIRCTDIDESWIKRFRIWALEQPIVSPKGAFRQRSLSTVENSVLQLAAAINHAHARHDTPWPAAFKPIPATQVNRTPQYRADMTTLIKMFRYATSLGRRLPLLRFLRLSVATLARPDAVHEMSTTSERGQWNSERAVLMLNPKGRRQTKKIRAVIPVVHHVANELDVISGAYVEVANVKKSFASMATELNLPKDGEAGMKLIRRSMADLLRKRHVPIEEIEIMLGHRVIGSVSELYAPFDPSYCANAKAAISAICDEIWQAVPNAFYRNFTAQSCPVGDHRNRKNVKLQGVKMVGVARIELATPAMSTQCSTTELHAHTLARHAGRNCP